MRVRNSCGLFGFVNATRGCRNELDDRSTNTIRSRRRHLLLRRHPIVIQSKQSHWSRQLAHDSHTYQRPLYSSQELLTAFTVSLPETLAYPGIQTCHCTGKVCMQTCLNHSVTSACASALYRVVVSCMLIVTRGPILSRHAGASTIAYRYHFGSVTHDTRIVVLVSLFAKPYHPI